MIILRQRIYSDRKTKFLFGVEKAKNSVSKAIGRTRRSFWNSISDPNSTEALERNAIYTQDANGKSRTQLIRESIKKKNSIKELKSKVGNKSVEVASQLASNPSELTRKVVKRGAEKIGESPIESTLSIALAPTPVPGTTGIAFGIGKAIEKKSPKYKRYKERYRKKSKHKIPEFLGDIAGSGIKYAQTLLS